MPQPNHNDPYDLQDPQRPSVHQGCSQWFRIASRWAVRRREAH